MRHLSRTNRFRRASLLASSVLLAGGAAMSVGAGSAQAAVCPGTPVPAGTSCTITGTLTLISGSMTLTSPTSLEWSSTLTGLDLHLVDTVAADQTYLVNDATGTAPGWHVTGSATTFTSGAKVLANAGTFSTNGSLTSITSAAAPTGACLAGSTCVVPVNPTVYPVAITTAASAPIPVDLFVANTGTGTGSIVVGGSTAPNPVGWWLNIPSSTIAGTYTSTITLEVIAGP